MKCEVFVPVTVRGFEGLYEVSNQGRLYSVRTRKIVKPGSSGKGYRKVGLNAEGKQHSVLLHRLVAEAFHGPSEGKTVNHKDGNKLNNAADNLEWMTARENNHHALITGLKRASQKTIDRLTASEE